MIYNADNEIAEEEEADDVLDAENVETTSPKFKKPKIKVNEDEELIEADDEAEDDDDILDEESEVDEVEDSDNHSKNPFVSAEFFDFYITFFRLMTKLLMKTKILQKMNPLV